MNKQDFIENQKHEIRNIWFKNHVASLEVFGEGPSKIERLKWANPEDSAFHIHYVTSGGCLMVYGDLGEQIYNFYRPISVRSFTNGYLEYYIGKAHDIEGYSKPQVWESGYATEWISQYLVDNEIVLDEDDEWKYHTGSEREFEDWFVDNCELDHEHLYGIIESVKTTNIRALSHFIGLQMANEQLEKQENERHS